MNNVLYSGVFLSSMIGDDGGTELGSWLCLAAAYAASLPPTPACLRPAADQGLRLPESLFVA